jgi:hypothetical protein
MKTLNRRLLKRRALRGGLIAVTIAITITACASLPVSLTGDICTIFRARSDWHQSALRAQEKWHLPLSVPMAVMYHESKFRSKAKPPRRYLFGIIPWKRRSSAYGYAQAVDSTWKIYRKETKNFSARRTDFNDAMDFIGWYISKNSRVNNVAKNDAYHQYLAYHEGWTGFRMGSWENKTWLKNVANEVDQRSRRYQSQYQSCAKDLDKPFWQRWFG